MKWENTTRQGKIIGAYAKIGRLMIHIHHYLGCGDTWFTSCYGIYNMTELQAKELEDAKKEALGILKQILQETLNEINFN